MGKRSERIRQVKLRIEEVERDNAADLRNENRYKARVTSNTAKLAALRRELEYLSKPKEPEDGSIIRFSRQLTNPARYRPTTYHYAAIRVKNSWYTTGATCPTFGYTWDSLLSMITKERNVAGHSDVVLEKNGKVIVPASGALSSSSWGIDCA